MMASMRLRAFLLCLPTAALLCCASSRDGIQAQKASTSAALPMCTPDQLSLGTDDENGNFDGMSHSGTLLVVRNLGEAACRLPAVPQITLYGASGLLNVTFAMPAAMRQGMHPGPVVLPVIVAAGAEVTANLRWVSNDVYDPGVCVTATSLHLKVAGKDIATATSHQLCGQKGKTIEAEMNLLRPDPVYRPGAGS